MTRRKVCNAPDRVRLRVRPMYVKQRGPREVRWVSSYATGGKPAGPQSCMGTV